MTNTTEYAQNIFDDAYKQVEEDRKPLKLESLLRRTVAYGLKAVAVFGGLAITAGVSAKWSQIIGVAIAAAIAIDLLFSNHLRVIAVAKASQAYKRLLRQVRRTHQVELVSILEKKSHDEATAQVELNNLITRLTKQLHDECTEIEKALDEMHIKALDVLSLEADRAKTKDRH